MRVQPPPPQLLTRLPVLALVLLAVTQIVQVHAYQLSPWKGGGFGMFSTNDHGGFRTLRAYTLAGGSAERLQVPEALRRTSLRAREFPTEARLASLARTLAEGAPDAAATRVEVWRLEFDADLEPSLRRLAAATFERTE
jgi:hypothetical protein